jgi:hypothetical protein
MKGVCGVSHARRENKEAASVCYLLKEGMHDCFYLSHRTVIARYNFYVDGDN